MMEGKIHAALRFLSEESSNGVHQLSEDVLKSLKEKNPAPAKIQQNSLLYSPIYNLEDYIFYIDEQKNAEAARLTKGAAGLSTSDTKQYRRILCSKQFNKERKELRYQIAVFFFFLNFATKILDPSCLEEYTASRLIPLDKNPGIRPIRIGEVLRRIVGKVVSWDAKQDIKEAAEPIQVCAGYQVSPEASIHEDNFPGISDRKCFAN